MRKMAKRALSFLLCIVLCMTMLPGSARAAEKDVQPAEAAPEELSAQVPEEAAEETAEELPAEAAVHAPAGEPVRSAGDVEINEINFPDANFRAYVSENCDTDSDNYLSEEEIAAVTEISCGNKAIASLKGVEFFSALTNLDCTDNQLTTLDVSRNTALKELYFTRNQLTEVDVRSNTALEALYCHNNQLTGLDVSANTALQALGCSGNRLTALDLSGNTGLVWLHCDNNQLTELDVSNNTGLIDLDCHGNQLTMLNISQCPNLVDAYLNGEKTDNGTYESYVTDYPNYYGLCVDKTVDVIKNLADLGIAVNETNFPDANFRAYVSRSCDTDGNGYLSESEIAAVTKIDCRSSSIASLKGVEFFSALEILVCFGNQLTKLDLSANTALAELNCSQNPLTELDVSKNSALTELDCYFNQLTALDVSSNTALTELECYGNPLTELDVSANTALTKLSCADNQLTALDVSNNTALEALYCRNNQLTGLDVSANTALKELYCDDNQLTELNLRTNTALTQLTCIGNQLTALNVSGCTALTKLYCDNNQLTTLDVSHNTALRLLSCSKNQLTALDVSHNPKLLQLWCYSNQLTALDVSGITWLEELDCSANLITELHANRSIKSLDCCCNQLTELDISQYRELRYLCCYGNRLTTLDISQCLKLLDAVQNSTKGEGTTNSGIKYVVYRKDRAFLRVNADTYVSEDGGLPHVQIYGCSLSLEGDIGVNFYLMLPEEIANDPDAGVGISLYPFDNYSTSHRIATQAKRVQMGDLTLYRFKYSVPAKKMDDSIRLRAYNGEGKLLPLEGYSTGESFTLNGYQVSVQDYIAKIRADSNSSAKLLALVEAMSDYGSAAQKQFNYNAGTAAAYYHGDAISAVTAEDLDPYRIEKIETERKGIELVGMTLTLESQTTTNLYFKVNEGYYYYKYSFYVDGEFTRTSSTSSGCVIKIPQIAAKNLDKYYKVEVYDVQGVCLTLKVPALYYAYQVLNLEGQSDTLVELVKALYLYNQAANAYFKK